MTLRALAVSLLRADWQHFRVGQSEVGTWDSLVQMDLVMSLEREYGIMLEIPDILRMTSIAGVIAVTQAQRKILIT